MMTSLEETVELILSDLREARDIVRGYEGLPKWERLDLLLARAELSLRELGQPDTLPPPDDSTATISAMSNEDYGAILEEINERFPDSDRLEMIKDMGEHGHFTSSQVRQLLAAFSFDGDRVEAAVSMYPKIIDKELFFRVLDTFDFDNSRTEVRRRLGLT